MISEKTKKKQVSLRTHAKRLKWVCKKATWCRRGDC